MTIDRYTQMFERFAFPALDRLNGTSIAPKLRQLLESEYLDPGEIRERQARKLAAAVDGARRASEFYRGFWRREPGPSSLYAPLDGLPVLTKTDLAAASGAFPVAGYKGRLVTAVTSGSTGSPMVFHRSVEQDSWFWALRFRMWNWSGYRPGAPYLEINLNPRTARKKRLQDVAMRCTYLTFNADNQDSKRIVEALQESHIPHLNGFSSSLYVLSRYMLDRGIANPGVCGITATGDTLYPTYRETIETAFGVRVLDYYGAGGEGVHLASQCLESGTRYHLHPENAVVEVLDGHGPVTSGTPGRIVVTQLDNEAMPLIRYELGDVAVPASADSRCTCGRTLPLLESIEGRIPDLIAAPDGSFLVCHFFVVLFKNIQSIDRYQVIQDEPDRIRVCLVPRPGAERTAVETAVRTAVSSATHGSLSTEFEWLAQIPLSGAGKRRLVISRLGREALDAVAIRRDLTLSA